MNNAVYETVKKELDTYNIRYAKATGGFGPIRNTDILAQNITNAIEKATTPK